MGKNNKARRAAKAKKRSSGGGHTGGRAGGRPGGSGFGGSGFGGIGFGGGGSPFADGPQFTDAELVAGWLDFAIRAVMRDDEAETTHLVKLLTEASNTLVERQAEGALLRIIGILWDNGWQPAELIRFVRRSTNVGGRRLAEWAVLSDHRPRAASTIDPAWSAQVEALDPTELPASGWVRLWIGEQGGDRANALRSVITVLAAMHSCGPLEKLIPPPGSTRSSGSFVDQGPSSDPVLEKVRALLAQAESTTFEAEAEAFTAKAQELMTRHAIDLAMVAEAEKDRSIGERPSTIRVPIDDPYADMKSLMLHVVADASRCRAIFHPRYSVTTVIGFAYDLASTEMLFTSLLVQAQTALTEAGRHAPPGARTRSRSFKSSFLMGYANRVGTRLAEINQAVTEAASEEAHRSVLPALIARADAVEEEMERRFADRVSSSGRGGYDPFGYQQGTAAADVAQLAFADLGGSDEQG